MQKRIRVFICHWHKGYRDYVTQTIQHSHPSIQIKGSSSHYKECLKWFSHNTADFLLVSFASSDGKKTDQLKTLIIKLPKTKIIVLSILENKKMKRFYLNLGA